jgi:uncharacterized protein (TIGR00251 family)
MHNWLIKEKNSIKLLLHVIPNAKKSEIIGEYNNRLKIKISSPPVDGSANKEIKLFFAKLLKISKSKIEIVKGEKSREKEIIIRDIALDKINKIIMEGQNANI